MNPLSDEKKALRRRIDEVLRNMDPSDRALRSSALTEALWTDERFLRSRSVFCYLSMPEEPDTREIVRRSLGSGKRVCLPRVVPGAGVIEARWIGPEGKGFLRGPFGILEPDPSVSPAAAASEIDCVVVPGLAFDAAGRRLGRGKGYYDRFLSGVGPSAYRVALAFETQRVEHVPVEPHDQKVDRVLFA